MRFMPILAFSIFSLYSGLLLAQNKDSPIIIDVPKELYNRLGLPSGVVKNEKCSNRTGCTRYCPKRPQCNSYYEFHNLVVANISDIKYEEPDPDSIPSYREDERKTVVNCFKKDSWSWEETINYKSTQTVIAFKQVVLQKVQDRTVDISISQKFMSALNIKLGGTIKNTISLGITSSDTITQQDDFNIVKPMKLEIPAMRERTIFYSDNKKKVRIPVKIKAELDGDIMYAEYIQYNGVLWRNQFHSKLWNMADHQKRTFEVNAIIEAQGSNRELIIRLVERELTPDDPSCINSGDNIKISDHSLK